MRGAIEHAPLEDDAHEHLQELVPVEHPRLARPLFALVERLVGRVDLQVSGAGQRKGVDGRGRAWKGVDGRGRAWKGVEGRGGARARTCAKIRSRLRPGHALDARPQSLQSFM